MLKNLLQIQQKPIDFFMKMQYTQYKTNDSNCGDDRMANYTEQQWNAKKVELMEKCYNGFADLGLHGTGIRTLAKH